MAIGDRAARVLCGIHYLNVMYPQWWHRVDRTALDMRSESAHVLCYATGNGLLRDTVESTWPHEALVAHGFAEHLDSSAYPLLTAEWSFILRTELDGRE